MLTKTAFPNNILQSDDEKNGMGTRCSSRLKLNPENLTKIEPVKRSTENFRIWVEITPKSKRLFLILRPTVQKVHENSYTTF